MVLTDTHCHIHSSHYEFDIDAVLADAFAAGVTRMLCVGTGVADSQEAVAFAQEHEGCFASIGIHPHEAATEKGEWLDFVKLAGQPEVVAVGECGLDYFYLHSPKLDQQRLLRQQIELALEHNLPIVFHVRDAFDDFWKIFESYRGIRGVLHSFTDNRANMERGLSHNLYIGVNGIVTFTKDAKQRDLLISVPEKRLLLETDAPYLTPVPKRGTINVPANVELVADFIARERNQPIEQIAAITSQNAQELFILND
ncbi:MAG TPA: TatD family hydrolase [Candidatus Saccharimonadales bacterium]|nr:TatD family hydrolase [Candidatus Saccharimonadales bacterium]